MKASVFAQVYSDSLNVFSEKSHTSGLLCLIRGNLNGLLVLWQEKLVSSALPQHKEQLNESHSSTAVSEQTKRL